MGGQARTYDAAGNTTQMKGLTYAYNSAGRLGKAKQGAAVLGTYWYNHRGERVLRQAGGKNTTTLYDESGQWLGDYSASGAPMQQVVWLENYPIAVFSESSAGVPALGYVQPDHLGTPRVIVDATRNVPVWEWDLAGEAFGADAANEDPDGDGVAFGFALRFPGQQATPESGLNYNYQRDYDAGVGRYVQSDPIGLAGGINTFGYVNGNPSAASDPLGLQSRDLEYLYKYSGATPPPPTSYYREFSGGVRDFARNYFDMREANTLQQDKYFHCKANCEAAKRGRGGKDAACRLSNGREIFDQRVKGDTAYDSAEDQEANLFGRSHAAQSQCNNVCADYRPAGLPVQY